MLNATWSFFIDLLMPIVLYFLALVSCIIAIKSIKKRSSNDKEKNGNKYNKFIAIGTLCGFIVSFYVAFRIEIPEPEIYIVNHDTQDYNEEYEMEIRNIEVFENYYTTNGTNPEYGEKYTGSFKVHNPTLVFAKSKFLWWWSNKALFIYPNEKLDNNITQKDKVKDIKSIVSTENNNETETQIMDETQQETDQQETDQQDSHETESPSSEISIDDNFSSVPQQSESQTLNEGINVSEGSALITYINQYRTQSGINELTWNSDLEQIAQNVATSFATGGQPSGDFSCLLIGRQCNGAKNAQRAVSDWITGNDYIPSEADNLLNSNYTQVGGALYYLPNGNEYGYHYFWVVCLM